MTRVNVGYSVKKLTTRHLLAEARELKRIPNMVKSGIANLDNIPEKFTLGKGHVKFFYNKLGYLFLRYNEVYNECIKRGFKITDYRNSWGFIPVRLFGYFNPTKADKQLIVDRINLRLSK